jgi:hypothetical protein
VTRNRLLIAGSAGIGAIALLIGAAAVARSQTVGDAPDPLQVAADTHKLAFENTFVRVLDVRLPPGKLEPRHRHPHGASIAQVPAHVST